MCTDIPVSDFYFIISSSDLSSIEQPWSQSAAGKEVGLLPGGGAEGPGGTGPVSEVPGVRVQLREPAVRLLLSTSRRFFRKALKYSIHIKILLNAVVGSG